MNVVHGPAKTRPPLPAMTREEFLDWVERQEESYEFDGERPVPMTGANRNHSAIVVGLVAALHARLRGGPFAAHLPEGPGVSPRSRSVRYPDVTVAPRAGKGTDRLHENAVVVFEVISPTSRRRDLVIKLREYAEVPTVRRYVVLESDARVATVFARADGGAAWTPSGFGIEDALPLPEIGVEVPMAEIYEGADIPPEAEEPRNPDATT